MPKGGIWRSLSRDLGGLSASCSLVGAGGFFMFVARGARGCSPVAGFLAPSPLRGEGWDEGRVLRRPSLVFCIGWVARLLACGGLSDACRRPSSFSLLAHATAGSGGERRSRPEGRRAGGPQSREGTKRNGLWSPPTLQAMSLEVFWNRRGSSCQTNGHTAPSPLTEAGEWVLLVVALRLLQRGRAASCLPRGSPPSPSFQRKLESSEALVRSTRNDVRAYGSHKGRASHAMRFAGVTFPRMAPRRRLL
jgi:hypothetical protein